MREWLTDGALLLGSVIMFLAGLGVFRLPDVFTRMQASTKAAILGLGLLLVGVMVHFGETGVTARALLVLAFIFLTGPVAAHMIGRAAYASGVPLWHGTHIDDMRHLYDRDRPPIED